MPRGEDLSRIGSGAPPLSGLLLDGTPFDLAATRSRPSLVEFLRGTW